MVRKIWLSAALAAALLLGGLTLLPASAMPVAADAVGTYTCTTDANGTCTVPHDLGATPTVVLVNPPASLNWGTDQYTAITFRVRLGRGFNSNNTLRVVANTAVTLGWHAIRGGASPSSSPSASPSSSPSASPSSSPSASPSSSPSASSGPPVPGDFPTITSVGANPDPTTPYEGDCNITTAGAVIENRVISCQSEGLDILASGVVIRDSIVHGRIMTISHDDNESNNNSHPLMLTLERSEVYSGPGPIGDWRAVGDAFFTVRDSLLIGHHGGAWCHNQCLVERSYVTTDGTHTHQSGIRMYKNSTVRNSTAFCNPNQAMTGPGSEDGGCSADIVLYKQFEPVGCTSGCLPSRNLTVEHNYLKRNPTGKGHYGALRWRSDCGDCTAVVTRNLFDTNQSTDLGEFPGPTWTGNYWTNGTTAEPGESA